MPKFVQQSLPFPVLLLIGLTLITQNSFADFQTPSDDVMVEIMGNIANTNQDDIAIIDRETVENLPQHQITTSSHITEVAVEYSGPLFSDLLALVRASGTKVTVTAWDDYLAEIPISDLESYGVLLATHENGRLLTLENKGPLYVVFPFSDYPDIRNDLYYNKSIWQIRSIEVE